MGGGVREVGQCSPPHVHLPEIERGRPEPRKDVVEREDEPIGMLGDQFPPLGLQAAPPEHVDKGFAPSLVIRAGVRGHEMKVRVGVEQPPHRTGFQLGLRDVTGYQANLFKRIQSLPKCQSQ